GGDADLSLFETALAQLNYLGTWVASRGYEPVRRANSAHQSVIPFQNFETADGWVVVACPKQALWERLCRALGLGELLADGRCAPFALRDAHGGELLDGLEPVFRSRTTAEWLDALAPEGVPCAPVNEIAAALADAQVAMRGGVLESEHPVLGPVRGLASPLRLDGFANPNERGPFRGEHTVAVLRDLCGYDDGAVAAP